MPEENMRKLTVKPLRSLDDIISETKEIMIAKGFSKHATLLGLNSEKYAEALTQKEWADSVKQTLGEKAYKNLLSIGPYNQINTLLKKIFGDYEKNSIKKKNKNSLNKNLAKSSTLKIQREKIFEWSDLEAALRIEARLYSHVKEAYNEVINEAINVLSQNKSLAYDVIIDFEKNNVNRLFPKKTILKSLISKKEKLFDILNSNTPELVKNSILKTHIKSIYEFVPFLFDWDHEVNYVTLSELYYANCAESKILAKKMINKLDYSIQNPDELNSKLDSLISKHLDSGAIFKSSIRCLKKNLRSFNEPSDYADKNYFDFLRSLNFFESKSKQDFEEYLTMKLSDIKTHSLSDKWIFFENYVSLSKEFNLTLSGIQQLLDGGLIINSSVNKHSFYQNDARFPNISYSESTLNKIKLLADKMKSLIEKSPDISGMASSSKIKNKLSSEYYIKELPKNPLDITFGNDSGCCVNVSELTSEMSNGKYVPIYLNDPEIKLFGIYRKGENSDKRMGFIMAFESEEANTGRKVFAVNSLELSKYELIGGVKSQEKLVNLAEDFLVKYAKKRKYSAVVMGSHKYNLARTLKTNKLKHLDHSLIFMSESYFYSDIFKSRTKDDDSMFTALPTSTYVLWNKE